jgi:hypothetical protein
MLDTLLGLHISEKFKARSDRIVFTESIPANDVSKISLVDAINGTELKSNTSSLDFILTKCAVWTYNGIIQVDIKPDSEDISSITTYALTEKTESIFVPPKTVLVDIEIELTNNQAIPDDVIIVFDILKVPQTQRQQLMDYIETQAIALGNIDIQTLGIEKFLTYTNLLLEELVRINGGTLPDAPYPGYVIGEKVKHIPCERI